MLSEESKLLINENDVRLTDEIGLSTIHKAIRLSALYDDNFSLGNSASAEMGLIVKNAWFFEMGRIQALRELRADKNKLDHKE